MLNKIFITKKRFLIIRCKVIIQRLVNFVKIEWEIKITIFVNHEIPWFEVALLFIFTIKIRAYLATK